MSLTEYFRMKRNFSNPYGPYGTGSGTFDDTDNTPSSSYQPDQPENDPPDQPDELTPKMRPGYRNPNKPNDYFEGTRTADTQAPPASIEADSLTDEPNIDTTAADIQPDPGFDYTRQTRDTDALRELLGQYPDREKYKPSVLRRIGSAFIGYDQGAGAQKSYLDRPYNEALQDWKDRIAPSENLANLERYGNTDVRQGIYQAGTLEARNREIDRKIDQGQQRINQNQEKIRQNQQKIDHVNEREDLTESEKIDLINYYKEEQVEARIDADKALQEMRGNQRMKQIGAQNANAVTIQGMRNTQSGANTSARIQGTKDVQQMRGTQAVDLADVKGTIQSNLQDKKGTQAIDQIDVRGSVNRDLQDLRGSQGLAAIRARGEQARQTRATAPGGANSTSQLPSQQKVLMQNLAGKAQREHPEWAGYISIDADGQVKIKSPGYFGPDKKTYQDMVDYFRSVAPAGAGPAGYTQVLERLERNSVTGATRKSQSVDGGKTWTPVPNQQ